MWWKRKEKKEEKKESPAGQPSKISRRFLRLRRSVAVRSKALRSYRAVTQDISPGGIKIRTQDVLKDNAEIEIFLDLEGGDVMRPVRALGRVAWRSLRDDRSYEVGIDFTEISQEDAQAMKRYIAFIERTAEKLI